MKGSPARIGSSSGHSRAGPRSGSLNGGEQSSRWLQSNRRGASEAFRGLFFLDGREKSPRGFPAASPTRKRRPILSGEGAHVPGWFLRPELSHARRRKAAAAAAGPARLDAGGISRMAATMDEWVGSAHLFVRTSSEVYSLPSFYQKPNFRRLVYKALKLALAESVGNSSGVDILKIHISEPDLIIQLKFCEQEKCRKFLRSYHRGELQQALRRSLSAFMPVAILGHEGPINLELKAGAEKLDPIIQEEERCLEYISRQKPDHLRDEEIAALEESLKSLSLERIFLAPLKLRQLSSDSSLPTLNSSPPDYGPPGVSETKEETFVFQNKQFANRKITPDDHQKFAKLVSKKWKQVGRSLYLQTKCRALRDPFIDNLAVEYEREGLYEQAYQLLRRYIDSEGKKATIQNLVAALEENGLINIAEEILGLHQGDLP
ncbi:tumor necrosis factor receptor type 1-associated DEATH domain protein [Vipera latastei]